MYFPPSTTKVVENIQQNSLFALDYSTLVASSESAKFCLSKINIIFLNSRLFMTRLSILNSCRSGVDIYWTNLSPARVLYFEFLTKPAVRLNQILKYPENFWRGEGNRLAPKCKFLQTCLSLSSFHLLYPPPPSSLSRSRSRSLRQNLDWSIRRFRIFLFFRYCFYSIDAWRSRLYFRASILQSLQPNTRRIFASTYGSETHIYSIDVWLVDKPMQFVWLHSVDLTIRNCQKI